MYKKIFLSLLCGLLLSFSVPAEALWLSGYEYRKEITIDHTKIGSDLSNFPLAVILSDTTNIMDGNDVKFTLSDGETLLSYEKEKYAVNDAVYWVNIPTVSSGTDTTFYLYYGKTGDTDESTTAVWDSNYKMVQHLEETSGTDYDSTSNANNGTPYGGVTQNATGQIDGGDYFDGSNDYLDFGNDADFNFSAGSFSIDFWFKTNTTATYSAILQKYSTTQYGYLVEFYGGNGYIELETHGGSGNYRIRGATKTGLNDGNWHYFAAITKIGSCPEIYIDGINYSGGYVSSGTVSTLSNTANFLISKSSTNYFKGTLDEVRISNTARSEDWIATSYYSGSNNLITFGNEEGDVIPEPTSLLLLGFGGLGIALFRRAIQS